MGVIPQKAEVSKNRSKFEGATHCCTSEESFIFVTKRWTRTELLEINHLSSCCQLWLSSLVGSHLLVLRPTRRGLLNCTAVKSARAFLLCASCREVYSQFLKEMIIQPGIAKANLGLSREDVTMEDHVSRHKPAFQEILLAKECTWKSSCQLRHSSRCLHWIMLKYLQCWIRFQRVYFLQARQRSRQNLEYRLVHSWCRHSRHSDVCIVCMQHAQCLHACRAILRKCCPARRRGSLKAAFSHPWPFASEGKSQKMY